MKDSTAIGDVVNRHQRTLETSPSAVHQSRRQLLPWTCAAWPVRQIDQAAFDDPSTTVPTLIVTPTLQPGNDPQWADAFQRGLRNTTVLTFSTLDGDVLGKSDPACLATLRRSFLTNPNKPLDTAACQRKSPPIQFLASPGG